MRPEAKVGLDVKENAFHIFFFLGAIQQNVHVYSLLPTNPIEFRGFKPTFLLMKLSTNKVGCKKVDDGGKQWGENYGKIVAKLWQKMWQKM
jgi:hypothetical protein